MKIKIHTTPGGSVPQKHRESLVGLIFEADLVRASAPKPNKDGWAYQIDADHAFDVLKAAGRKEAAQYYGNLNPYPAMQSLRFCVETDKAAVETEAKVAYEHAAIRTDTTKTSRSDENRTFASRFEAIEVEW
jgi:hypothetical protein